MQGSSIARVYQTVGAGATFVGLGLEGLRPGNVLEDIPDRDKRPRSAIFTEFLQQHARLAVYRLQSCPRGLSKRCCNTTSQSPSCRSLATHNEGEYSQRIAELSSSATAARPLLSSRCAIGALNGSSYAMSE